MSETANKPLIRKLTAPTDLGEAPITHAHNGLGSATGPPLGAAEEERLPLRILCADARSLPLPDKCVDLIVTSPPYWRKRDYGLADQIGQEDTPTQYVAALLDALKEWRRVLRSTGSVFLNIGDTYWKRSLAAIPGRIEAAARDDNWIVRNRIIWAKEGGSPDPAKDRLASRHEYILHLAIQPRYYYDLVGYGEAMGSGANPGDVWRFHPGRNMADHLAPFSEEIARRAILLACPREICPKCDEPRRRITRKTATLNLARPQARRAIELARMKGLTAEHIAAIQATGISDAGKARRVQTGTDRNSARVRALATEAKAALGGYFREFTFAKRETTGWTSCGCGVPMHPGVLLDPFMGTGTALQAALRMGRWAYGADLEPPKEFCVQWPVT